MPAGVVGLTLHAAAVVTDAGNQGDLFDRGFATAAATEAALASLAEEQGDVVVVPENTAHPLVERRTNWVGNRESESGIGERERGNREPKKRKRGKPLVIGEPNDHRARRSADSRFPVPDRRFPVPRSRFPVCCFPIPD